MGVHVPICCAEFFMALLASVFQARMARAGCCFIGGVHGGVVCVCFFVSIVGAVRYNGYFRKACCAMLAVCVKFCAAMHVGLRTR